jgi:hypothetical protein
MDMIVEYVKIDKTIFVETYTREEWLQLFKECHIHCQEEKEFFFLIVTTRRTRR